MNRVRDRSSSIFADRAPGSSGHGHALRARAPRRRHTPRRPRAARRGRGGAGGIAECDARSRPSAATAWCRASTARPRRGRCRSTRRPTRCSRPASRSGRPPAAPSTSASAPRWSARPARACGGGRGLRAPARGRPMQLDPRARSVRAARAGASLDLGGVAKGFALDLAARELREAGVDCALLHGGTSSVAALGAPPGESGWRVAIEGAHAPEGAGLAVLLRDASLSVSAAAGRTARGAAGRRVGHVLDPAQRPRGAARDDRRRRVAERPRGRGLVDGPGGERGQRRESAPARAPRRDCAAALARRDARAAGAPCWTFRGAHERCFQPRPDDRPMNHPNPGLDRRAFLESSGGLAAAALIPEPLRRAALRARARRSASASPAPAARGARSSASCATFEGVRVSGGVRRARGAPELGPAPRPGRRRLRQHGGDARPDRARRADRRHADAPARRAVPGGPRARQARLLRGAAGAHRRGLPRALARRARLAEGLPGRLPGAGQPDLRPGALVPALGLAARPGGAARAAPQEDRVAHAGGDERAREGPELAPRSGASRWA